MLRRLKSIYTKSLNSINQKIEMLMARQDADMAHVIYQVEYQKALKKQITGILDTMQAEEFTTVAEYLTKCYEEGFVGVLYDLHGQQIPLCFPINQEAVTRAVQLDSKISQGLYNSIGENVAALKKTIAAEVSRGISIGLGYSDVAKLIRAQMVGTYTKKTGGALYRSELIARTEGHRVQVQSAMDACYTARDMGADVVKEWDATLDSRTRKSHQQVDGEVRELDEYFSNGLDFPGDPAGGAKEVCNCRCALHQRARWAVTGGFTKRNNFTKELMTFDSKKTYNAFKKDFFSDENVRYMDYVGTLQKRYQTKDFRKILNQMTEREYSHYSKLLEETPIYNGK